MGSLGSGYRTQPEFVRHTRDKDRSSGIVKSEFVFPDANTAYFEEIEVFMRKRVEIEQQTISSLQVLLKITPTLPERKLSWHCALEKLVEGTRQELEIRMEELEALKSRMQAVTASIAEARNCIGTLNREFRHLDSTGRFDCAQVARKTLKSHNAWRDAESAGAGLSGMLSLSRAQREKKQMEGKRVRTREAYEKYHMKDLRYRRTIHKHQENRKAFLNSLPHRVQEYGTKYQTVVSDLSMLMESFANYLRNVSSTCSSSGSTLWAASKNIKPLVDANRYIGPIELVHPQSKIKLSPILYRSPWTRAMSQAVLFGCPLELQADGELPPVLKYLFDSFPINQHPQLSSGSLEGPSTEINTTNSPLDDAQESWSLVNEVELAWTGVEASDRAFISKYDLQSHHKLLGAYFHALPERVFSPQDIVEVRDRTFLSANKIWDSWSQDAVKVAVARAVLSCESRVNYVTFCSDMAVALSQGHPIASRLSRHFSNLTRHPQIWR